MRAVFFGTPAIAVPTLRALAEHAQVVGVVSQPDRPAGRGRTLRVPEVKQAALELGLEVFQPERVRDGALERWLRERSPDFALVLAYGRILPPGVLAAPRLGCLNFHASLLPAYRGAAPIQRAIMSGETETGMSLMQMDEGLDTGPVFARRSIPIGPDETGGELTERLGELAASMVSDELLRAVRGELAAEPQDSSRATLAPPIERPDCVIDWSEPEKAIHDRVRALLPRPSAFTTVSGKTLRVLGTARFEGAAPALRPGVVCVVKPRVLVGTGTGPLELVRAQLEGRRELSAFELVNGRVLAAGLVRGGAHHGLRSGLREAQA